MATQLTFTGEVTFISPLLTGVSKDGKSYEKSYFTVKEQDGQYPNEMKFELFNAQDKVKDLTVGSVVTVGYNTRVNATTTGGHFQNNNLWKIDITSSAAKTNTAPPPSEVPAEALPF